MEAAVQTLRSFLVWSGITAVAVGFLLVFGYLALAGIALVTSGAESLLPEDLPGVSSGGD